MMMMMMILLLLLFVIDKSIVRQELYYSLLYMYKVYVRVPTLYLHKYINIYIDYYILTSR